MVRNVIALFAAGAIFVGGAHAQDTTGRPPESDAPAADGKKDMDKNPRVKITTTLGEIVLELDAEKAPITVDNFVKYAESGFYDGLIFHRVMNTFMIQGGGHKPDLSEKTEGLRPGILNEWKNGLKNDKYTIAMARKGGDANSATAQFFINVVDNDRLSQAQPDGAGYAVFGKVVEGTETVDKIRDTKVKIDPKYPSGNTPVVPETPVVIQSVKVINEFDRASLEKAAADADPISKRVKQIEEEQGKKFVTTPTGLRYLVVRDGQGDSPKSTSTVKVHYRGTLVNGKEFDSSYAKGDPIEFSLDGVIKGWTEGVGMMKVGEKRIFVIPPNLAYGARGAGSAVPPNATLVFEVELLGIPKP